MHEATSNPLIVFLAPALSSNALRVKIVLLLRLFRPWKEESARAPILEAILVRAVVQIQPGLDCACQASNTQLLGVGEAAMAPAVRAGTHHFGPDSPEFCPMVTIVFLVIWFIELRYFLVARTLS